MILKRTIFGFDTKVIEVYKEYNNKEELNVFKKNILDLDLSDPKLNKDIKKLTLKIIQVL
ncbi:MAG: hypothetical protein L6V91_05365 [Bacilli bacterium]|nr:MAG: hypothetical protein L6V91_05365 [Bacilli bacterium]